MYSIPVYLKVNPEAGRGAGWMQPWKAEVAVGRDHLYKAIHQLPKYQMGKDRLECIFLTSYSIAPI